MSITKLRLFKNGNEIPFPPGSDRGISGSMEFISEAGGYARLVDGTLVYTGDEAFDSYAVEINCSDQKVPAIGQVKRGDVLTMHYLDVLTEPGPAVMLSREPVPGSIVAYDANGNVVAQPEGRTLNVPGASYFEYRPILSVMVTGISYSGRELAAASDWTLTAEENGSAPEIVQPEVLPDELVEATGGIVTDYTDADGAKWRVHDFLSTDFFDVSAPGTIEYAVISGGGGSSPISALFGGTAGPGAGGFYFSKAKVPIGTYSAIVGSGGAAGDPGAEVRSVAYHGRRGNSSEFLGASVIGGGAGMNDELYDGFIPSSPENGASGGGRASGNGPGSGIPFIGNPGGPRGQGSPGEWPRGGGGGAGGPAPDDAVAFVRGLRGAPDTLGQSGSAGVGVSISELFGIEDMVCCGAPGGEEYDTILAGEPAVGGSLPGEDGAANTGNAGGPAITETGLGGNGASGRVIIRYLIE